MKIIAVNKSASFEYFIEDKFEAGIVLEGAKSNLCAKIIAV